MKKILGLIIGGIVVLIFVGLVILAMITEIEIGKQEKLFCEDFNGIYDNGDCLIEEDDYYQKFDIDWEGKYKERRFYLVRE